MKNWFFKRNDKITVDVVGVNPQTDNEFKFFEFVSNESPERLEGWYKKAKELGYIFKPQYENAINDKLKNGTFINPYNFRDTFGLNFDFIAIDFETANEQRISACALGIVFVQNNSIVHSEKFLIKPPKNQAFNTRNINIHGISPLDVENEPTFDYYWHNILSEYFKRNLIVFHNASMDLSVLRQLLEHYGIEDFSIMYIDTMNLASYLNLPKKLTELAEYFNIEVVDHHNPEEDAILCAKVFSHLKEQNFDFTKVIYTLSDDYKKFDFITKFSILNNSDEKYDEIVDKYLFEEDSIRSLEVENKSFLFTGDLSISRDHAQSLIIKQGGIIKKSMSSKVDYVIIGRCYGWSKIEKVDELNTLKGLNIKILNEDMFHKIVNYMP